MIWLHFWAQYWNCVFAAPKPAIQTAEIIVLSSRRKVRK